MKAGLRRLGSDFGNGAADRRVLQLDREWPHYRANKLEARTESLDKYYCTVPQFEPRRRRAVTEFLSNALVTEYPGWFSRTSEPDGGWCLRCGPSGEKLRFDGDCNLAAPEPGTSLQPPYADGLDALAGQIQEDIAVVDSAPEGEGRVVALHLCAPNHWAAGDRIGRNFQQTHGPVPQFGGIARHAPALLQNLRDAGPYVRFAWGVATDNRLNHHPQPPSQCNEPRDWHGRRFEPHQPRLYLRVERQVIVGLPQVGGFVFLIRTYLIGAERLDARERRLLADAIRAMTPDIARYKGLLGQQNVIAEWLAGKAAAY